MPAWLQVLCDALRCGNARVGSGGQDQEVHVLTVGQAVRVDAHHVARSHTLGQRRQVDRVLAVLRGELAATFDGVAYRDLPSPVTMVALNRVCLAGYPVDGSIVCEYFTPPSS